MHGTTYNLLGGLAILSLALLGACTTSGGGGGTGQIVADFEFNDGEGLEFEVIANEDSDLQVNGSLSLTGPGGSTVAVSGGTIMLTPGAITVVANGNNNKALPNLQAGEPLSITAWIDAVGGAAADFCASGDEYGPFIVTVDENLVPTSVDPDEVTLTDNTVNLINGGDFDLCIRVNWTMDATVTIDSLRFEFR